MLLAMTEPLHLILRMQNTIEKGMLSFFYWCRGEQQIIQCKHAEGYPHTSQVAPILPGLSGKAKWIRATHVVGLVECADPAPCCDTGRLAQST